MIDPRPLPAHRYETRKKSDSPKVWVYDFDETITKAPKQCSRIAAGLKALGDKVIVLTGNQSPRDELTSRLDDYGFPFDDLIQYQDEQTDGLNRAAVLKQLDAWGAFDDRAGRGYTLADVCPHFFLVAKPPKAAKKNVGGKKDAKKAVKQQRDADPDAPDRSAR